MKNFVKPIIFLVLIIITLILSKYYGWTEKFMSMIPNLREFVEKNFFMAMIIYIITISIGCVVLALPGATFAMIAGLLFEPLTGIIICLVAATLGAILAFLAGRYFLRDSVRPMLEKNAMLKKFMFDDINRSGIILLMVTRLVPLFPYNLQNFAYGITNIKLSVYAFYTFIFMAPGVIAFTLGAAGIVNTEKRFLYFILAVIIASIVSILGIILRKKFIER